MLIATERLSTVTVLNFLLFLASSRGLALEAVGRGFGRLLVLYANLLSCDVRCFLSGKHFGLNGLGSAYLSLGSCSSLPFAFLLLRDHKKAGMGTY